VLKTRILTAICLISVLFGVIFFMPPIALVWTSGLFFSVAAWEWANLSGISSQYRRVAYAFGLGCVALLLAWYTDLEAIAGLTVILSVACVWWLACFLMVLRYPASAFLLKTSFARLIMGGLSLVPAWLSLVYLSRMQDGAWVMLFLVFTVAAADVGAYFAGKAFGRRKLAPKVSPGKTWEGVAGGLLLVSIAGLVGNYLFSYYLGEPLMNSWVSLLLLVIPCAISSVVGDLFESMTKRYRGIKDSGQLLPGHGGVMDRIDGLVAATPIFTFTTILNQWQ